MPKSNMNWQKGIKRAAFVTSIIAFIFGFFGRAYTSSITEIMDGVIEAFVFGCVCFAVVWVIYFTVVWIVVWIIKGFLDENNRDSTKV